MSYILGEELQIRSGTKYYSYNASVVVMQDLDYIIFEVKACQGARIALEHIPGVYEYRTFEVEIGIDDNKGVAIRDTVGGPNKMEAALGTELLHCDSYRTFWISWREEMYYSVGRGSKIRSDVLIDYKPEYFRTASGVAFDTPNDVPGDWKVKKTGSESQQF